MNKESLWATGGLLGTLIGSLRAPHGRRIEGAGRGAIRGAGTGLGVGLGGLLGTLAASESDSPAARLLLALGGVGLGGLAGWKGTGALIGKPSWEQEKEEKGLRREPAGKQADWQQNFPDWLLKQARSRVEIARM